jgi:hypothetical protein
VDSYLLSLWPWIVASILVYVLASVVTWYFRQARPGRWGRAVAALQAWPWRGWPREALRFGYYIGPPYAALLLGVASPRLLGLSGLDWAQSSGLGAALGAGACILLLLGWWQYARATRALARPGEGPLATEVAALARPWGGGVLLLEMAYLEAHWAFYRAGAILLFGDYAGVFLGCAIAILEMLARPQLWSRLRQPGQADGFLLTTSLAFVVAILFLFTHNLWVCAVVHGGLALGLLSLLGRWQQKPALTSG